MRNADSGLNDNDKLIVTLALWIACIALFATALTLPMLPSKVTIFYNPTDPEAQQYFSKYNNLMIVFVSVIPSAIVLVAAFVRDRKKTVKNFPSVMLFAIMLSICMGGVTIYGISQQIAATEGIEKLNIHALITLIASALCSFVAAATPTIVHSERYVAAKGKRSAYLTYLGIVIERNWDVGAYGFLLCAIFCTSAPGLYSYIPFAVCILAATLFFLIPAKVQLKRRIETALYDQLDN